MIGSFGTRHKDGGSLRAVMSHRTHVSVSLSHRVGLNGPSGAVVTGVTLIVRLDVPLGGAVVPWLTCYAFIG